MKNNNKNKVKGKSHLLLLMLCGGVVGGIVGGSISVFEKGLVRLINSFESLVFTYSYQIFMLTAILFLAAIIITMKMGEKRLQDSIDKDEDLYDDNMLGVSMTLSGVSIVTLISLFAIYLSSLVVNTNATSGKILEGLGGSLDTDKAFKVNSIIAILLLMSFIVPILQKKIIERLKNAYPEKRGDAFTMSFKKDWVNSMDEREKNIMHEAGYKAFGAGMITIFVMIFIALILTIVSGVGAYPILALLIIYIVMMVTYTYWSIKLDK